MHGFKGISLAPCEIFQFHPVSPSTLLHHTGCDEDIDPGEERGERPLPQQLHLHIYEKVFGLTHLSLQVDRSREAVKLPGTEVAFFIAFDDTDEDVIPGVGWGRPNSEDLGGGDDVGLEAELVIRDAQGGGLTV